MKPFIFQFMEAGLSEAPDYSTIEYDNDLNLSVDRNTGLPAIDFLAMDTETFTKTGGEGADSDKSMSVVSLETQTMTFVNNENSDSDKDISSIRALLDTTTATRSIESSDQDR